MGSPAYLVRQQVKHECSKAAKSEIKYKNQRHFSTLALTFEKTSEKKKRQYSQKSRKNYKGYKTLTKIMQSLCREKKF